MLLVPTFDGLELVTDRSCQALWAITLDWESTALFRSVECKRRHDEPASGNERAQERAAISCALARFRQKMKDCPIMPNVILSRGLPLGDVGNFPVDLLRVSPQSFSCCLECRCCNVENCKVRPSATQQRINQIRGTAADIDQGV